MWLRFVWYDTLCRFVAMGIMLAAAVGGWLVWTGSPFSSMSAGQNGLHLAPFLATDAEITRACAAEGCEPDWKAKGRDGVAYRLVRVGVENSHAPRVLAIPERLLDRLPFPECELVATSALAGAGRVPGKPIGCRSGAVSRIALVATLPDFEPAGRAGPLEREERTDLVTMVIDVTREQVDFRRAISAGRSGGLESWLTAWGVSMARKGYMITQKQPLHGLKRLGPEHGLVGRDAALLSDVLYTGEAVGGSSDVLMCTVEEALLDDGQPKLGMKPLQATCWHWFLIPELGLDVRLSYDRTHLRNWLDTRNAAIAKVRQFANAADPDH